MAKFTIIVSPSYYCPRTDMVSTMIAHALHHEDFEGSIDEASAKVQEVKAKMMQDRTFDHNCGFTIQAYLFRGARKPNGFDKRRRELCDNYINHAEAIAA
jgi:hypothetical protein